MIVAVQGTSSFSDYNVFLRAMGVAMSALTNEDGYFYIYSAGPGALNSMVSEFVNLSERGMKSRGKKIKFYKVAPSWIEENLVEINYFAFFSLPNESHSKLVDSAKNKNIETAIFSY
jgi:hypothetical protein